MATFVAVSKSAHADSAWLRAQNFGFSASMEMVSLLGEEIAFAMPTLPLAFRLQRDATGSGSYHLVALLSLVAGRNLLLNPDGSWLTEYVPALLRGYPFRLLPSTKAGEKAVAFDQESGLLTDANTPGSQRFFDGNGEPAPPFRDVLDFLGKCEQSRAATQQAVDALAELNLIVPWNIVLKDDVGREQAGVVKPFKIDGAALQRLSAEQLAGLHGCGALMIAHAQLLSEPRIQNLGRLMQEQAAPPAPGPAAVPASDLIDFSKL